MSWPTPQDYNEAVQNPQSSFTDLELQKGRVELNGLGLPRPITGGFASVYKIQCGHRTWAARCFLSEVDGIKQRYQAISDHLRVVNLPQTVPFSYLENGIRVRGRNYPLVKMEWVQGESLVSFVEKSIRNPQSLITLARNWKKLVDSLRAANVAHGDLQHGNISILGNQLRLLDYDGMFVPSLAGKSSNEVGHRNYQLPSRTNRDFGPHIDNFSAWVIYVSLVALAAHPNFWLKHRGGDECLLFRKEDFENPRRSSILNDLGSSPNKEVRALVGRFVDLFKCPIKNVPFLDENLASDFENISVSPPKQQSPWWAGFTPDIATPPQRPAPKSIRKRPKSTNRPRRRPGSGKGPTSGPTGNTSTTVDNHGSVALGLFMLILVGAATLYFLHIRQEREAWRTSRERQDQRTAGQVGVAEESALARTDVSRESPGQGVVAGDEAVDERSLAEAKLKLEAEEAVLATNLGLRRPFGPGERGELGSIAVHWIPAGQFTMGSRPAELGRELDEAQHTVVLSRGLFLAETECTQSQWVAVMGSNPSTFKGLDQPVEQVNWREAVEYCRKLTSKQRLEGILPESWEWRLPTEAEWEYAARAGTTGARYGDLDSIGWYEGNSNQSTHLVKRRQPNTWGLYDIIGNVSEWCWDGYGYYPSSSVTDPKGQVSDPDPSRVNRGGSWLNDAMEMRSANRNRSDPDNRSSYLGFRPALSSK